MTTYCVAKTVAAIATGHSRLARRILDRTQSLDNELVMKVVQKTQCHYAGRRPRRPGTSLSDMDLASYLLPLWQRGGVVQPLFYRKRTPGIVHMDQYRVAETRFGELTGLVSHQEHLSFGVELLDHSIVQVDGRREKIGTPRTFMLVDYDGSWHMNPALCVWNETDDEAVFNAQHGLFQSPEFTLKHFVHPHRRESVFGAPYLLLKLLHMRIVEELKYYQAPRANNLSTADTSVYGEIRSQLVPTFVMSLEGPQLYGEYPSVVRGEYLSQLRRNRQLVQWLMRAAEVAFALYGKQVNYTAPWVRDVAWHVTGAVATIELHPTLSLRYKHGMVSKKVEA